MIRIGIADDQVLMRKALANFMNQSLGYEVILEASSTKELVEELSSKILPEILIIGINIPITEGINMIEKTRYLYGGQPQIIVLSNINTKFLPATIKKEIDGIVPKSATLDQLFEAIASVISGKSYLSSEVYSPSNKHHSYFKNLNATELEILKLICEQKSNQSIASELNISLNTVNTYRTRMLEKLNAKNSIGLALFAVKNGIHFLNS